ncbi:amino acid adenylation domain-containing protein [Amycolatopsis sp. lyj-23]|uniref:amino acid adenylation domain-containing protein n=1 Tax=Amycolatopsis sp. lyj-23 TaxID=2789283 RepID=UPI00397BC55E
MTTTEGYPLSPQQRRLWELRRGGASPYRSWCVLRLAAGTTADRTGAALAAVAARHEILRTTFRSPAGASIPLQVIADAADRTAVAVHDLRPLPDGERAAAYAAVKASFLRDADDSPLSAAFVVLEDSPLGARLLLRQPALCADEASVRLLAQEVGDRLAGTVPATEPLQYADFAPWQAELLTSAEFDLEREYWQQRDAGRLAGAELPFARRSGAGFAPAAVSVDFDEPLGDDGPAVALACWHLLVRRLTGRDEAAIGVRLPNRVADEMAGALGLYEKYVPSLAQPRSGETAAAFVAKVTAELAEMADWQSYFDQNRWTAGPAASERPGPIAAGFDWYRGDFGVLEEAEAITEQFTVRLSGREHGDRLRLSFWFDSAVVDAADARVLAGQYVAVLRSVRADGGQPALAVAVPAAAAPAPARRPGPVHPIHRRFEAHARRDPGGVAVRCLDESVTRAELDARADRLARRLLAAGARPDTPVGLCLDRSIELVVAVLAILKSGAAYLPLDPDTPPARRRAVLDQAGARLVVASAEHADVAGPDRALVTPDGAGAPSVSVPAAGEADARLAYVIFTSGSTGTPKGVAVSHANLAAYVDDVTARLDLPDDASYAMLSTPAADLGHTTLFAALATGGTLDLLPAGHTTDPALLVAHLREHPADCLKIVPSHLRALLGAPDAAAVLPAQCLVLGGEAADWALIAEVNRLAPDCRVVNHYGPTETTVGVLTHEVRTDDPRSFRTVPLGTALPHSRVEVLDSGLQRTPTWVAGEIHVGGAGVARGYLGRPGLTADRFVPDPFGPPGSRVYRTGDRARRLRDGTVAFLGRTDDQLKLRGYRVEPAEVQAVLRTHPAVRQAVVTLRENDSGGRTLVAYVVAPGTDPAELRARCAEHLPEYMVPGAVLLIERIPLTANGKLDHRALPAPGRATAAYQAPRTPVEETLASIWQQVLRVGRVGRDDNFFALGGDSILGIQVMSRAAEAGLALTPKLLFQHPTVGELAAVTTAVDAVANGAEQGPVTGALRATPIQRRFLAHGPRARHHYNQEVLVALKRPLAPEPLRIALRALIDHHDALRIRVRGDELGIAGPLPASIDPLATADLAGLPAADRRTAFEKLTEQTQSALDLGTGCVFRALLADLGDDGQRLLLVAHHLGVDGVSWRILLGDLVTAYQQAAAGTAVRLPPKTVSYRAWAERLAERESRHIDEIPFWTEMLAGPSAPSPRSAANTYGAAATVTVTADEATTGDLVRSTGATSAQALILAALGQALTEWTGEPRVVVDIEGHGRDALADDLDVSRTVGWFTTIHPLALDAGRAAATAQSVKQRLAEVPAGGVGYGLLRYGTDPAAAALRALPEPWVRFNYHGRLVADPAADALFGTAPEDPGPSADPAGTRPYLLDLTAVVAGGRLRVSWTYCPAVHDQETVQALADGFLVHLRDAVSHGSTGWTPADFPLAQLDQGSLDTIAGLLDEMG